MFGAKPTGFGTVFGAGTSGFGGNSTPFGQSNNSFATKPAAGTTGFGTPTAFGTSTPAPSSGLFGGGSSTTGTSLFGATPAASTFGQQQTTGFTFGATPTTSVSTGGGMFGTSTGTTGGLFSTPSTNTAFGTKTPGFGGFGGTTTGASGLFGTTPQPAAGSSLFGSSTPSVFGQAQTNGTTFKFNPPNGQDTMVKNGVTTSINTRHQCITAMKEYEAKSLEELRLEDYSANRKGKQAAGGLFGTPATATQASTGFGFGQNKTTGFSASTGFGTATSTGTGLFGAQTSQASSGLFGGQNKTSLFGTTSTPAATPGFGGFGASTSTATPSLFAGNNQNKTLFGATPATTQTNLFGGTATSTFGGTTGFATPGFGTTPASGGLFGAKPTGFGTPATTSSTFAFGNNTGSNLFAKPIPPGQSFNFATPSTASAFGSSSGTSLFNKPLTFGATTTTAPSFSFNTGLNSGGTLFGNSLAKPGFGLNQAGTTLGGFGTGLNTACVIGNPGTLGSTANTTLTTASQAQVQQQLMALAHSPYGDSPLFTNLKQSTTKREDVLKPTNPAAQKAVLSNSQYKVSPRPASKIKPKSLHHVINGGKAQLFEGLEDEDFGNDTFMPRKNIKKLVLKKHGGDTSSVRSGSSVANDTPNLQSLDEHEPIPQIMTGTPERSRESDTVNPESENIIRSRGIPGGMTDTPTRDGVNFDDTIAMLNARNKVQYTESPRENSMSRDDTENETVEERPTTPPPPHPAGILLTRPGYYTVPAMEDLAEMLDDNDECNVDDFTVGREGYGSVFFPGVTNVAGLNLDEIVHFRRKEVVVYPDEENKPELGIGLNKKAEVTLDCIWPNDRTTRTPIKSPDRIRALKYQDKIEEITNKIGAKFVDYRPETGSWVFEVKHFSKYGLVDDSDEEDMSEQDKKRLRTAQEQQLAVQKQKIQIQQQQQALQQQQELQQQAAANGHPPTFQMGIDEQEMGIVTRREVPMADDDMELPDITQERFPQDMYEMSEEFRGSEAGGDDKPSSHRLATSMGVTAERMQVMKASFFGDEDEPEAEMGSGRESPFERKGPSVPASPLLRHADVSGPSLFSSALKSKYMSPVKLPQLPQNGHAHRDAMAIFPSGQRLHTPEPIRPSRPSFQPPVAEHMLLASGMTTQDFPHKIVGSRITRSIPPIAESTPFQKQHFLVDSGLFMGRSFRVGWGPGWTLAHTGTPIHPHKSEEEPVETKTFSLLPGSRASTKTSTGSKTWNVTVEKLNVGSYFRQEDITVQNNHEQMLMIQLDHSEMTVEDGCPFFVPSMGVDALHQYAEQNKQDKENTGMHPDIGTVDHMGMVWDLCVALWGNIPEFRDTDVDEDSYAYHLARREAFSQWLSSCPAARIKKEVQESRFTGQGHMPAVLSYLSGRQISEACSTAQQSGDHRLALLLAQAVGSRIPRQMLDRQLSEWAELEASQFIHELRLKVYAMLSGKLVWPAPGTTVNVCEGLDWKRALALHLWFLCRPNSPIQESLEEYENAYKGRTPFGRYAQPPIPPYLEDDKNLFMDGDEEEDEENDDDHVIRDTCYHLLCLYCQKSHRLERILNTTTSTANQLDYRLSWHLSQILQSLSYRHLSPYHIASLHMNLSSQLESLRLWEWAVFVSLHIEDSESREYAVRDLLNRHIRLSRDPEYMEKEEFIEEKLQVPKSWIHDAKALRAHHENRYHEEAWHLLKAGHWNDSHCVILQHIAAEAIINENYDYLKKYLVELSIPERSTRILDWQIGGRVFLDYINLCEMLEELKRGELSAYELERLQPEVNSLCSRVGTLHCRNSKDRLCQSEMAKKSAILLRTLLTLQSGGEHPPTRLLAPHISNLPMPEDYHLQELRALTRSYMLEMTA